MDTRKKITDVFISIAKSYQDERKSHTFEIVQAHDVHAFVQLPENLVIHMQGYPGLSSDSQMYVSARLRDYSKMMRERLSGTPAGNEHSANLPTKSRMTGGVMMAYSARSLKSALDEIVESLYEVPQKAVV